METLLTAATAALAAAATSTSTTPTVGAHNGIAPAAAMPTPFDFPCGINFLSNEFHKNKHLRDVCGPPNFENYWWSTIGYYSPAVCPRGYTAGCFRWNSDQGPPVEPTETAVQCVPRGYKCKNNDISAAFSGTATAPMIQIRWASTDLSSLATHPLYPGANPTNTEEDYLMKHTRKANLEGRAASSGYYPNDSGGGSPPRSSTSRAGSGSSTGSDSGSSSSNRPDGNSSGGADGGLSTGAKVGIGLGVSLGAIFGFTVLGLIIWRVRTATKRSKQFQAPQQPYMVPSQYAGQPGQGPSSEQYNGGQQPSHPQPVYQQQSMYPQHQQYPSMSEMDNNTSAATSHWAANSVMPPPAAAVAADRSIGAVTTAGGSSIGSPQSPPSELAGVHTPNPPVEMGSGSPAVHHAQPVAVAEQQRPAATDPQSFVGAPPEEPSAEELSSLREQHSQLEQRRQRILELERIEQEQEALRGRMSQMQGGQS
ncbi:hypothetical protein LMH87_000114 [Akanthomyces muscarius]|uniref:Uncharacterized protein n=1 Tax=Akanthomyces muscarius TaxID=2231603 RepID=A0A9W8QET8_AKAMU|nr:hypothetical protein LMH87_000114 [Akanthomyces muscarius]KAJ4154839.1 hypothetical protein LMH87_000114 [Akanthomyces muscarius]